MLLLPDRHQADQSLDAGTMDATDVSSPRSVTFCAISGKSLGKLPKQPAQTAARNLPEQQPGMGTCCTTSASEELLEAAVLDLQSQPRCQRRRRETKNNPYISPTPVHMQPNRRLGAPCARVLRSSVLSLCVLVFFFTVLGGVSPFLFILLLVFGGFYFYFYWHRTAAGQPTHVRMAFDR